MKLTKPILVGGLFLTAIAFAGDLNADFKKFMTAEATKTANAFNTKNLSYFQSITTADFTQKENGTTYNKTQAIAQLKQWFGMAKSIKCSMKLLSSKVTGNTGVAMTSSHAVTVMPMSPQDKKLHNMQMDSWEKLTWVRTGNTWKLKLIEEAKPTKMTMDGKPFSG